MTAQLDGFLDAVELHRQRDVLEAALRGIVSVLDAWTTNPNDPLLPVMLLNHWTGAKLLLATLTPKADPK